MRGITTDIKPLIPKGQVTVPLRIAIEDGILSFTVHGICTYVGTVKVDTTDVAEITTNYLSISEYLSSDSSAVLDVTNNGVHVECKGFSSFLMPAFSTVESTDFPDMKFQSLENSSLVTALHKLSSTGLEGLYKKDPPIEIFDRIAILKYPNIYVQMRAPEFGVSIAMTQDCAEIIQYFNPKEYCIVSSDTVVFKKYDSLLAVPMKIIQPGTSVKDIVDTSGYSVRLDTGKLVDKLTMLRNLKVDRCSVVLMERGMSITVSSAMSTLTISAGDSTSDYSASFEMPTNLLCLCFKLLGDSLVEILYKEGVLCLRTPTIAIAVHVLI